MMRMFHAARFKLTAWYLIIIMVVSISFSAVIYRALTMELERFGRIQRYRIEHRLRNDILIPLDDSLAPPQMLPIDDPELVNYIKRRMLVTLIIVNGSIFVLSGLLGYMLAGRTLKPIADMVDEQNRFISDASHELRTPLTALKATLEVNLRDKNLTAQSAKTVLQDSIEEVNSLQSLTDSLLTLAQYQKSGAAYQFETLDLNALIAEAVKRVTPIAREKNVTIKYAAIHGNVSGIRHSLTDLFTILLENAVKYSRKSGTVGIRVLHKDKNIRIFISDHGIGIADKDLPYIFDRFYRADNARTKYSRDGYGLGLSIAKKIAGIHRGTIEVTSKPFSGSTFTVTLP